MPDKNKLINIEALAQAIDTTWGRSSSPQNYSFSVKISMLGASQLKFDYHTIFNFANDREMVVVKKKIEEEALAVIKSVLTNVKKRYKDICDQTLSTKESSSDGNFELVGFGSPSTRKSAHFRFTVIFEI